MALFMTPLVGTVVGIVSEKMAMPGGECVVLCRDGGRRWLGGRGWGRSEDIFGIRNALCVICSRGSVFSWAECLRSTFRKRNSSWGTEVT